MKAALQSVLFAMLLPVCAPAFAGGQQYEVLSASVKSVMAAQINSDASEDFISGVDEIKWVALQAERLRKREQLRKHFGSAQQAQTFLEMVYYEASRAGLDPELVLAVIDVESKFNRYAVSVVGARGLMQVMPFWTSAINDGSDDLFPVRTNLRYGCTILRHYLDLEHGNLFYALGRYNGSRGVATYPDLIMAAWGKYRTDKEAVKLTDTLLAKR